MTEYKYKVSDFEGPLDLLLYLIEKNKVDIYNIPIVEITDQFNAYVALPESGRGPAVVIGQEIFGVNANIRSVADRYAEEGYVAIAPDLFWRLEPGIQLGYEGADREKAFELFGQFDVDKGVEDIARSIAEVARGANDVSGNTAEVSKAATDVSRNAAEAAQAAEMISSNIHGVSEATRQNSASSVQVNEAAKRLKEMAEELQRSVSRFSTGEQTSAASHG